MSTKNNTRYSMRLRQNRGGDALSNLGGGDNGGGGDGAASSRSSSRAALVSLKGKMMTLLAAVDTFAWIMYH